MQKLTLTLKPRAPVEALQCKLGEHTVRVDAHYDPTSPNAQAGTAVAEAIATVSGDKTYTHVQLTPESVWTVTHNLNKRPSVTVVDSAENIVIGEVVYIDDNTVEMTFQGAFSGKAYFN